MAGIYIHIPFCRQACHYCDFHFSTNLSLIDEMVSSICKELQNRKAYIGEEVSTIYFGGGTPSLLSEKQLDKILSTIYLNYSILSNTEITLEANPEDLTKEKVEVIDKLGINRLSIGLQTFQNNALQWMNRNHNEKHANDAYNNARDQGFTNISLDLIYALPVLDHETWKSDLEKITHLNPEHISIYGLTIEENTVFGKWAKYGKLKEITEGEAASQYLETVEYLRSESYRQYEVSNFSKEGYESKHNSSYWRGDHYLGVGPGAHSYNGSSRQLNLRNNPKYIKTLKEDGPYFEIEDLTETQKMNETVLTSLRTKKGINILSFEKKYNVDFGSLFSKEIQSFVDQQLMDVNDESICLTSKGFLVADAIALKLFFDE